MAQLQQAREEELFDCTFKLRDRPVRRKNAVRIGCGAGFAGDRPRAAQKLLQRVPNIDYIVLECLAERTFTERVDAVATGGTGYDPRIVEWMTSLLPLAVKQGVCIITNMGAVDPLGAQQQVLRVSFELGLQVSVAVACEHFPATLSGSSTYLGAAPIVRVLEQGKPHVLITSRLADASLFLGPMVYELGWNWNDYPALAQGALAGHLLECGCQLTGGYYTHPADRYRSLSAAELAELSLPYADISWDGKVVLAKAEGSGGELSRATCTEQLLYEIEDPCSYITPDVIIDLRNVEFKPLSKHRILATGAEPYGNCFPDMLLRLVPKFCGWKAWGEISYGGACCEERASLSDQLVRSWMEEAFPGVGHQILSYSIGKDSLFLNDPVPCREVRLRMDGLFNSREEADELVKSFGALYTNGPASGGGISSAFRKEIMLDKQMVPRDKVFWKSYFGNKLTLTKPEPEHHVTVELSDKEVFEETGLAPSAPAGTPVALYHVAHSRTGDKGNTLNVSLIPYCSSDLERLQQVITPDWVKYVISRGLNKLGTRTEEAEVSIYVVRGVSALNIVVKNALDGGVTCSRRVDRHGKTLSDLILSQQVTLKLTNN